MNIRLSVLLLGNSHFLHNDLAGRMTSLGLDVYTCASENAFLQDHATFQGCIDRYPWDAVVVEENNAIALNEDWVSDSTIPSLKTIAKRVRRNHGATRIMVMESWAYREGMPPYLDRYGMQGALATMAVRMANAVDAEVAHVGSVGMKYHWDTGKSLWMTDGDNPSEDMSDVAALVLYHALTGGAPEGKLTGLYSKLDDHMLL